MHDAFTPACTRPRDHFLHDPDATMSPLFQATPLSVLDDELTPATDAAPAPGAERPASTLLKALGVFDMFSSAQPTLHVEEVAERLGLGKSTAYRYMQELCECGFLNRLGKGAFSLGSKIIELEKLLRVTDPVLVAGQQVMHAVQAELCVNRGLLLCTPYRDRVMCIHQVGPETLKAGRTTMPLHRGRGTAFPLFKGAGSQSILAWLPMQQVRSLYLQRQDEVAEAGMGTDWKAFLRTLAQVRKSGYARTAGRVNRTLSLGVPILAGDRQPIGSLLLVMADSATEQAQVEPLVARLQAAAAEVAHRVVAAQA